MPREKLNQPDNVQPPEIKKIIDDLYQGKPVTREQVAQVMTWKKANGYSLTGDNWAEIVLGTKPGPTKKEAKRAFHQKMKEVHPDLHPHDQQAKDKAQKLTVAFEHLRKERNWR